MRKLLIALLAITSIAFAYEAGHEAERDHAFQEHVKDPGYTAGAEHEDDSREFETGKKDPGYSPGAEHEVDKDLEKKKKK